MINLLDFTDTLLKVNLFKDFSKTELSEILKNPEVKILSYSKDDVIFMEEETCKNLSIILEGFVEIQKIDPNGKVLTVASLKSKDAFGENLLFGDKNIYPMTVLSKSNSIILHIPKQTVAMFCQKSTTFLYEFLKTLSNKAVALSSKLKQVTLKTIRQKICDFLYLQYNASKDLTVKLTISKKDLADKLGVQRPSLSRELIKMKEDGIIDYNKDFITICDLTLLEENL